MTEVSTVAELRELQLRLQQEQRQKELEEEDDTEEDEDDEDEDEDEDEDDTEDNDEDDDRIIKDDITKYKMPDRTKLRKVKQSSSPQAQPQNANQQPGNEDSEDEDDDSVDSDTYNEEDKGILWIGHTYGVNHTYIPPMMNTYGMEKPVDEDAADTDTFRRWFFSAVGYITYWTGMGRRDKKKTNPAPNGESTDSNIPQVGS